MTKVLYVFGGEKASGAEIVIERLMSYNIHHVEPHLFVSPGKFADELISSGKPYPVIIINRLRKLNRSNTSAFKFFSEAIKNYFLISSAVIKYIRKNKISIIHANTIVPASYLIPAIIFCFIINGKKIWIWSDHDLQYFSKIDHIFSKLCATLFDKTLAVSEAVRKKYGSRKSAVVLYNGLDTDTFKENANAGSAFRSKLGFQNELILGIAATISPRKGQLELIKVFDQLLMKHNNIRLILAGSLGSDDAGYNNKVADAIKENPCINFIGHVKNMIEFYSGCDIIISNSTLKGGEPLGTTIYEGMSCEKIVVASDTGGTSEIISNEIDGFTFAAEDFKSLKNKLEYIITNINSLHRIKSMARSKVQDKFSLSRMEVSYNKYIQIV